MENLGARPDPLTPPTGDPVLAAALATALAAPARRIAPLTLADGRKFWLKRVENLSLRLRLQKGNPARSFAKESANLHRLAALGLAVPEIAAAGEDYILIADAGPNLRRVIEAPAPDPSEKLRACQAAGRALAGFHLAGQIHGRPAPRDICWDGDTARFIDLERSRPAAAGSRAQAFDLLILVQSCMTIFPEAPLWLDTILAAYIETAPPETPRRAARLAACFSRLGPLIRLLQKLRPKSREIRALSLTLAYAERLG